MVRFIHTTPDRPRAKRKQAPQACDECRRRKKRCGHLGNSAGAHDNVSEHQASGGLGASRVPSPPHDAARAPTLSHVRDGAGEPRRPASTEPLHNSRPGPSPRDPPSRAVHATRREEDAHFVGDLNPESTFLADSPETTGGYREPDAIGVWVSRRTSGRARGASSAAGTPYQPSAPTRSPLSHSVDKCLSLLPTGSNFGALHRIYLQNIHKILPVLDINTPEDGEENIPQILFKQAVCLAAGAHPEAKPFLSLQGVSADDPLPYTDFSDKISSAMRTIINSGLVKDRTQVIPILVVLSLHTYSSPDRHLSAELAALAVSYTHTVGLHLQTPATGGDSSSYLERLFCCVWAMDRLTAAFHGRPVLMHDRDCGRDLQASFGRQQACFRLFLENVALLDSVIHLYRPTTADPNVGGDNDIPSFEKLVEKAGAFGVESRLLVTIELLYHAIVILSCRAPSPSIPSTSHIDARESLSSITIATIVSDFDGRLSQTFLPYAVSLALRTTYRELRASTVPTIRARAYARLQAHCHVLRRLGDVYRPASSMVELVDRLVREIDRVSANPAAGQSAHERSEPPSILVPQDGVTRGARAEVAAEAGEAAPGDAPPFDPGFPEGLARMDVFDSLDLDFDFDALDAVFGDGAYPYAALS